MQGSQGHFSFWIELVQYLQENLHVLENIRKG